MRPAEEVDSWLAVVRLMTWLPWSIDQQLRRDSDLTMVEYQVLAMLLERPGPRQADEHGGCSHQRVAVPPVAHREPP